jgi:hypothetical protein
MTPETLTAMRIKLAFLEAAPANYQDANKALKRLQELEATRPTPAEVSRAALAGAGVGTLSAGVNSLVSGGAAKALREGAGAVRDELGLAAKAKLTRGQALRGVGKGLKTIGKNQMGAAAGSAVFGAALPFAKRFLDRRAEMAKLKDYVEDRPRSRLARGASQYLGV